MRRTGLFIIGVLILIVLHMMVFTACEPTSFPGLNQPEELGGIFNNDQEKYYPTIQDAIDDAHDGDTITLSRGRYLENITFSGANKNITLMSDYSGEEVIIKSNGYGPVVTFTSNSSTLQGLTITGGNAVLGGGILIEYNSSPTIIGNNVTGNTAVGGAGIHVSESNPLIVGNVIKNNTIPNRFGNGPGGGINVSNASRPVIKDNIIKDNTSYLDGGGIGVSYNSELLPAESRAEGGWGSNSEGGHRYRIPDCPYYKDRGNIAGNTFSGNTHTAPTENPKKGYHVYFDQYSD